MSIMEAIASLKERVLILRGVQSITCIAKAIGIDPNTLRAWIRDDTNVTSETLRKIERWVATHDQR